MKFTRQASALFLALSVFALIACTPRADPEAPADVDESEPPAGILSNPTVVKQLRQDLLLDLAKWAMPFVSFFANKDALMRDFGVETGTVVYWSKPFGSEVQLLTPNDTSLYFTTQLELFDGPITAEIPAVHESGINFFGSIMNAWQTPLEDVGPRGADEGKGGRYFITPPDYTGRVPHGVIHIQSNTYNVVLGVRVTPRSFDEADLKAAADYGRTMKVYSAEKSETAFFDASGKPHNPLPPYGEYFDLLNREISNEPMLEHDARFYGIMNQFGIKGQSDFRPTPEMEAAVATMIADQRDYFRRDLGAEMFAKARWELPVDLTIEVPSQFSYLVGGEYDWKRRALTYHWAIWGPKYLGAATFYLVAQFDKEGRVLDADKVYKLSVPANVPARQFWSATAYNMDTYSFYRDVHTVAVNSLQEDLTTNEDRTTDVYFAPALPDGVNRGNWIPTGAGTEFFVLFRWYGPQPELFDGSWTMGDLELQID